MAIRSPRIKTQVDDAVIARLTYGKVIEGTLSSPDYDTRDVEDFIGIDTDYEKKANTFIFVENELALETRLEGEQSSFDAVYPEEIKLSYVHKIYSVKDSDF